MFTSTNSTDYRRYYYSIRQSVADRDFVSARMYCLKLALYVDEEPPPRASLAQELAKIGTVAELVAQACKSINEGRCAVAAAYFDAILRYK